jgi:hypothetical protein
MKKSKIYLSLFLALFIGLYVGTAFINIKNSEAPKLNIQSKMILESRGSFFADTINASFQYIKSDFPAIQLDPRLGDQLIIEGWEEARNYIDSYVKNDTLFVIHKPSSRYRIPESKVNSEWTLLARIGAKGLQGIHLFGDGNINHQARATGARLDGTPVFSEEILTKYKLQVDKFFISLDDYAKAGAFSQEA